MFVFLKNTPISLLSSLLIFQGHVLQFLLTSSESTLRWACKKCTYFYFYPSLISEFILRKLVLLSFVRSLIYGLFLTFICIECSIKLIKEIIIDKYQLYYNWPLRLCVLSPCRALPYHFLVFQRSKSEFIL